MAQNIKIAVDYKAKQYRNKPLLINDFVNSVRNLTNLKGSAATKKRKQRAARLLYQIHSKVDETTFVLCTLTVCYTILASANIGTVIETLTAWRRDVTEMDQLVLCAAELCSNNISIVSKLLLQGEMAPMRVTTQNVNAPTPGPTDVGSSAQTHPDQIEGDGDFNFRSPQMGRASVERHSDFGSSAQTSPKPAEELAGFSFSNPQSGPVPVEGHGDFGNSQTHPTSTDGRGDFRFSAQAHPERIVGHDNFSFSAQTHVEPIGSHGAFSSSAQTHLEPSQASLSLIPIPWEVLVNILSSFDHTCAQFIFRNRKIVGFSVIRHSEIIATISMTDVLVDYCKTQLLRPAEEPRYSTV
jgi:hypothetical protein